MGTDRKTDGPHAWERYPEYVALQQFSRCLGRILYSLPRRQRKRDGRVLVPAAVFMAQGMAGAHAEVPADESLSLEERQQFRRIGLESAGLLREALLEIRACRKTVSIPDLLAALELLERAEEGLRSRPLPGAPSA